MDGAKRKDWFIINSHELDLNVTSDMEKAMHISHGVGYDEYARNLNVRMKVEKQREKSYAESHQILNEYSRRVFK